MAGRVPVDHADPAVLGFLASPDAARLRVEAARPAVLARSVKLLTVSGGGHTAFERSPCVAEHLTLYLVEPRVWGGHAC